MLLIYQTREMERALEVIDVLGEAGIATSLQDVHAWNVKRGVPLTVWVLNDDQLPEANRILEEFFAGEKS